MNRLSHISLRRTEERRAVEEKWEHTVGVPTSNNAETPFIYPVAQFNCVESGKCISCSLSRFISPLFFFLHTLVRSCCLTVSQPGKGGEDPRSRRYDFHQSLQWFDEGDTRPACSASLTAVMRWRG